MAWAIAQHDAFMAGPEIDLPFFLARDGACEESFEAARSRDDGWLAQHDVDLPEFFAAIGTGIHTMLKAHVQGCRWVDSTPGSVLQWKVLMDMFPTARFVHMLRDGRSVVASLLSSGFDIAAAKDFRVACDTWATMARKGRELVESHPDRCVEIRQEQMAIDPFGVTSEVFALCGEADDPRAGEFLARGRVNSSYGNKTASDIRKAKPHESAPKAPWSNWSKAELRTFERTAGELMQVLGYGSETRST